MNRLSQLTWNERRIAPIVGLQNQSICSLSTDLLPTGMPINARNVMLNGLKYSGHPLREFTPTSGGDKTSIKDMDIGDINPSKSQERISPTGMMLKRRSVFTVASTKRSCLV